MFSEKDAARLHSMQEKISDIRTVIERHGGITNALADRAEGRAALLMNLVAIAEQFDKFKKSESNLLGKFDEAQLKGFYSIRTFIAHDYDGVSLPIVEDILRVQVDILSQTIGQILTGA